MPDINRQICLASRPDGAPAPENFDLKEAPIPEPGIGQVLTRTIYLSLDPYMRGRMNAERSYADLLQKVKVPDGLSRGFLKCRGLFA